CHAGEAREAAIDVGDDVFRCRAAVLQHLLDEIDAATRRVALVAQQHVGRACRRAEAAMHAGAKNLVGLGNVRIGKLRQRKRGLHHPPAHMRPGLSTPFGSKLSFTRLLTPASAPGCGSNTSIAARIATGARMSVACPPTLAEARRIAAAPASSDGG